VRIAVLADVHGNVPALRAVLAELDAEALDAVIVAGDVLGGPQPLLALLTLASRCEPLHWIAGNCEREALAAYDGAAIADDEAGRAAAWSANALDRRWRDTLATWPITETLDGVAFCHGSPRRDDEVLTRLTPDDVLADALGGAGAPLVVGGHTHQQVVRSLGGGRPTYVNAGSVGMPYEGRPGAFWALVADGVPALRETAYDVQAAARELTATGFPDVDSMIAECLLSPVDPDWVTAFFEHGAGRGDHPGDAREH
jgi:predicted phosphodiesterase